LNELIINGEVYIKKEAYDNKKYVVVRSHLAGCFAGYLESYESNSTTINLTNARRLWYWEGASSLSQLAMEGVKKPQKCKFPCAVDEIKLTGVIEIINTTEKAKICIESVPIWAQ
jgi:hypothetical protein